MDHQTLNAVIAHEHVGAVAQDQVRHAALASEENRLDQLLGLCDGQEQRRRAADAQRVVLAHRLVAEHFQARGLLKLRNDVGPERY